MKHLLVCFLIVQSYLSFSEEGFVIDSTVDQINLNSYIYHFEDTSNILTVNQVQKKKWVRLNANPTFASNKHVQWISFNIDNPYKFSFERYLFIPYHLIHEIDVYAVTGSSIKNIIKTGIKRPITNKHLKSIGYPVLISFKPQQTTNVLVRLEFLYRPLRATTYLLSKTRADEIINNNNSLIWFWRGMFLFVLIMAITIYWFVRLKLFLYYIFFNIGVGLFTSSQLGAYFLFFNIDSTGFTSIIDFTGTTLICLFLPLFLNELTPIKKRNKLVWKWMYYMIYFMVAIVAINLIPAVRESFAMYWSHLYIMFTTGIVLLLILIFLIKGIKYKDKNAIPLLIIYGFNTLTAFSEAILPNLGIVEDSPYVLGTILITTLFEITSFMVLMARESLLVYKERSELLEKQQGHQKQMIVTMVAGQEDARNRAGRELHDSIGANMAIIKRQVGRGNMELYKIVGQTIESVRALSHGMVTPMVNNEGFVDEMKELCFLFSSDKIEVHCYFHNWPKIDNAEITTHLYRIAQELLQNADRHSKAKNVYFQFIGESHQNISLVYEDDGIGFNHSKTENKGLGLRNIENRVALLDGALQFDTSTINKGCTIVIEVGL